MFALWCSVRVEVLRRFKPSARCMEGEEEAKEGGGREGRQTNGSQGPSQPDAAKTCLGPVTASHPVNCIF